jgi:hypothetical protein
MAMRRKAVSGWLGSIALAFAIVPSTLVAQPADSGDFDAVVRSLQQEAQRPAPADPALRFPETINPSGALLSQLQGILGRYFSKEVNLVPLLRKIIIESAVADLPDKARILYNPSRELFFLLPKDSQLTGQIRIATLGGVDHILGKTLPSNLPLVAYTRGFEDFNALAQLMRDPDSRGTLQVIWMEAPRSEEDKKHLQLLLLEPIRRGRGINTQPISCKQAIDHFVDDVRGGRNTEIPLLSKLTGIVRPSNYFQNKDKILLVLSEALVARY